jgi:hypothetical protein
MGESILRTRPRLYLDVDGVLNAYYKGLWGSEQLVGSAGVPSWSIHWNPDMVSALAALITEYDVELVWCTTWREDAPVEIGGLLGFGQDARVLHPLDGRTTFPSIEWKREAVLAEQILDPSLVIWVDDEIDDAVLAVWEENDYSGLLINPDPQYGIQPDQIEAMRKYLNRFSGLRKFMEG